LFLWLIEIYVTRKHSGTEIIVKMSNHTTFEIGPQ